MSQAERIAEIKAEQAEKARRIDELLDAGLQARQIADELDLPRSTVLGRWANRRTRG